MQLNQTPLVIADEMNEYQTASALARHIWSQTFPHMEGLEVEPVWKAFHSGIVLRKELPDDVKGQPVGGRDGVPVAVGDVLIMFDRTGRNKGNKHYINTRVTQQEIMRYGGGLRKVVKVSTSGKSIDVVRLSMPSGYWSTNLATLTDGHWNSQTPERYVLDSDSRELGRLGTYDEIVARVHAHPSYSAWEAAYAAAGAVFEADEAKSRVARDAETRKREAVTVQVKIVNHHTGTTLLEVNYAGSAQAADGFLRKEGNLRIFIAGLVATGRMTTEDSLKVADALKVLKL